jgi:hypothetical protein
MMAETSRFWDGIAVGDAATAPYSSDEYARVQRDLIRASEADSGPLLNTGVAPDLGLTVRATTPASASVEVTAGSAIVRGTWYNSSATETLAIGANASGNPRIDTIILRKDYAAQTIRLVVLPGAPAVTPSAPALTQTDGVTWELPLADIAVANGFATLANTTITPRRHWANAADGVYLDNVLNNSGVLLQTGDVVVWDTTADRAITTSVILGDPKLAGVWVGRTAAGGYGRVQTKGIGLVRMAGQVLSRGLTLVKSNTAKAAQSAAAAATASKRSAIGLSLEIVNDANYLCWTAIDVGAQRDGAIVMNTSLQAGAVTGAWAISHATHTVTITPHTTRVKVTAQFPAYLGGADIGYFDIYSVGLAARAGTANEGLNHIVNETDKHPVTVVAIFSGLTPGIAQEFQLWLKTSGAQALNVWWPVHFYAEEI